MNLIQQYISSTPDQLKKIVEGSKELFASVAKSVSVLALKY